jgi:hypothetical protein
LSPNTDLNLKQPFKKSLNKIKRGPSSNLGPHLVFFPFLFSSCLLLILFMLITPYVALQCSSLYYLPPFILAGWESTIWNIMKLSLVNHFFFHLWGFLIFFVLCFFCSLICFFFFVQLFLFVVCSAKLIIHYFEKNVYLEQLFSQSFVFLFINVLHHI